MNQYQQYQAAEAIREAARNEGGGLAGAGAGHWCRGCNWQCNGKCLSRQPATNKFAFSAATRKNDLSALSGTH